MLAGNNNLTGIEFNRASFAFECAEDAKKNKKTEYRSYVKRLPMLIKTNGLAASFAFMFSKKNPKKDNIYQQDDYLLIGQHICKWLMQDPKSKPHLTGIADFEGLVSKVTQLDSVSYRAVTGEVIAFLNWLRRYADGLLKEK